MWDCTQSLPILVFENKTVWAWLPKADKQACGWPGTKSSPTKRRFWGYVPIKSIVRFWVGWDWLRYVPDLRLAWLCYPQGALLYHYYICVVVVHSCLCQALIRHEWGASLADVGLHSKSPHVTWEQNCAGLAPQSEQTSLRVAKNKILPHSRELAKLGKNRVILPIWILVLYYIAIVLSLIENRKIPKTNLIQIPKREKI